MTRGLLVAGSAALIAVGIVLATYAGPSRCGARGSPTTVVAAQQERSIEASVHPPTTTPTLRQVVTKAAVDRMRRAEIAQAIAATHTGVRPTGELTKDKVRGHMRILVPMLADCYGRAQACDPKIGGVVNTKLTIDSEPGQGTVVTVRGFDTSGALGQSREFRDCVSATIEAIVLPPIADGGSLDVTYPMTFAPQPPDNHDTQLVDQAQQAAADRQWGQALIKAERGLELTSIDGTFRRKLIEIAGLAACHLKRDAKARYYFALASSGVERVLRETCVRVAQIDLTR
jgi:hypothetical protein